MSNTLPFHVYRFSIGEEQRYLAVDPCYYEEVDVVPEHLVVPNGIALAWRKVTEAPLCELGGSWYRLRCKELGEEHLLRGKFFEDRNQLFTPSRIECLPIIIQVLDPAQARDLATKFEQLEEIGKKVKAFNDNVPPFARSAVSAELDDYALSTSFLVEIAALAFPILLYPVGDD